MNLRPSGYEPDELPGCSIPRRLFFLLRFVAIYFCFFSLCFYFIGILFRFESFSFLSRFGGDLLSHVLRRSTIGATALNGRVRDGIGCFARAMTTKPRKKRIPDGFRDYNISGFALLCITIVPCFYTAVTFCDVVVSAFDFVSEAGVLAFACRQFFLSIAAKPCCFWIKSSLSSN